MEKIKNNCKHGIDNKTSRNKKYKKIVWNILLIICLVSIVFSIFKIINWYKDIKETSQIIELISNTVTVTENDKYYIDFYKLKQINPDTVAWIKVNGTNIEYPIVKASDNDYYIKHSFDKSNNCAGWIFADYRNKFNGTDKNIILYGHNMRDGSMFCSLKNVINSSWYENEENRKIIFITEEGQFEYEVFSVYEIKKEDYDNSTDFGSSNKFSDYINTVMKKSIYNFNVDVNSEDNLLTLSTCANDNRYRVILHAKQIK